MIQVHISIYKIGNSNRTEPVQNDSIFLDMDKKLFLETIDMFAKNKFTIDSSHYKKTNQLILSNENYIINIDVYPNIKYGINNIFEYLEGAI